MMMMAVWLSYAVNVMVIIFTIKCFLLLGCENTMDFFFIFELPLKECAGILKEQRHILHRVNIYLDTDHV